MLECFSEPRPKTGLIGKRWSFAHVYSSAFVSSCTVSWTFGLGSLGANDTWPRGCGLSWLPFWVCRSLSKFPNGFLSWWWNLISLSVPVRMSAGRRETSAAAEHVSPSARCWCKTGASDIAVVLHSSGLLLLVRTPFFPLYFLESSHTTISLAACSWLSESHLLRVHNHLLEYSVPFSVVVALPTSFLLSQWFCRRLSQLLRGSGVLRVMLSFASARTQLVLSSLSWRDCSAPPKARWGV